jgi:hypothetical protein
VNFLSNPLAKIGLAALAVLVLIVVPFWIWFVQRTEVGKGEYLIVVHRVGKDLPEDEIIAPDDSYKGVKLQEMTTGMYFFDPFLWSCERYPLIEIKPNECLVLTRKYGKRIPEERIAAGQILAQEGERGIVAEPLGPGLHHINPYAFDWQIVPAVQIRGDQVGVRTLKVGRDPRGRAFRPDQISERYVVDKGFQGIQREPVSSGTHYVNPYVESITPVEVNEHQVELTDIEFPSRDGFILKPHVKVGYAVVADMAPELLIRVSSEGKLHQEDGTPEQIKANEILQRIILPHIRGYARIEGSNFDARDFVGTAAPGGDAKDANHRIEFQKALFEKVRPKCREVGIDIRNVTLEALDAPKELTDQIKARDLARQTQEKNKSLIDQYKSDQTVKAAEGLKQRAQEVNSAETRRNKAKIEAEQKLANEKLRLENDLAAAKLKLEAAKAEAQSVRFKGEAEAAQIDRENEAQVAGIRRAIEGFSNVQVFAQFQVMSKVAPALMEIFASDDSDFAKLFATYLNYSSSSSSGGKPAGGGSGPPAP